jgi:hypothetical protein
VAPLGPGCAERRLQATAYTLSHLISPDPLLLLLDQPIEVCAGLEAITAAYVEEVLQRDEAGPNFDVRGLENDFVHSRVLPQQRPVAKALDLLIQAAAHPRDLVLGQSPEPHLLDQAVDLAGAHPVHIRLLDDRDQRLLRPPARLQERRQIAPGPKARDLKLDLPNPRVPTAITIPAALRLTPTRSTLTMLSAG